MRDAVRYRTRDGIVAALLAAACSDGDGEGAGITTIARRGNVSYPRAAEILRDLVRAGLLAEVNQVGKTRYAVTRDGFHYLERFRDLDFAKSFGLRL